MAVLTFDKEVKSESRLIISRWITREYRCMIYGSYKTPDGDFSIEFTNCKGLPKGERPIAALLEYVTKDCYTIKIMAVNM